MNNDVFALVFTKTILLIGGAAIAFFVITSAFQPLNKVCEPSVVITLEKSIIEQKYAVEIQNDQTIKTVFTTPEKYATLQTGQTAMLCHSEGTILPVETIFWIE